MMMTFYHIKNIDHFFQVINTCAGGVFFQTNENQFIDIRHNELVKKLLELSCSPYGIERLDIYIECADDRVRLLQYMM